MSQSLKFRRLTCLLLVALTLAGGSAVAQDSAAEVAVKAAIAHKIVKFVSWPDTRFEGSDQPLRFCVLGDTVVLEAFEALKDRPIHGRMLSVNLAPDPGAVAESCDVLYLANDERHSAGVWLEAVSGHPVLTFAEAGGYAGEGSIVAMAIRRNKVRFSINLEANENTELRISGQLLQLAASVGTPGHSP